MFDFTCLVLGFIYDNLQDFIHGVAAKISWGERILKLVKLSEVRDSQESLEMMLLVKNGGFPLFHGSFAAPSSLPKRRKLQLLAQAAVPSRTQVSFTLLLLFVHFLSQSCCFHLSHWFLAHTRILVVMCDLGISYKD